MNKTLLSSLAVAVAGVASAQFVGFESSESYNVGQLDGQNGWNASPAVQVTNNFARTGNNSAMWGGTGSVGNFWFDFAAPKTTEFTASVFVFIDGSSSADRIFGIQANNSALFGPNITLASDGTIRGSDASVFSAPSLGVLSGAATNRWVNLGITYTPGAATATVFADAQSFVINLGSPLAQVTAVDLYTDWIADPNSSGLGYFDDYSVDAVPEPATLTILSLGLAGLLKRRKK